MSLVIYLFVIMQPDPFGPFFVFKHPMPSIEACNASLDKMHHSTSFSAAYCAGEQK